ncbi:uncharacterized protein KQ657_003641 [Scheffersomyces spartinae]|uniref:Uncharacterized protein n=1 Tax=Scheffersomyces spartinae TaxID=45513 RepID=A0A9P8AJS2_9ASCO|nr:uncharacterized protein KQ657_003641 [Scheffersomyces spartinae]KAG7195120.1 hypothetical protein KQ657_003641 [Scheffersomyces spartinae]
MSKVIGKTETIRIGTLVQNILQDLKQNASYSKRDVERLRYVLWWAGSGYSQDVSDNYLTDHIVELLELCQTKFGEYIDVILVDIIVLLAIRFQLFDQTLFCLWQTIIDVQISDKPQIWTKLVEDLLTLESNFKYMSLILLGKSLMESGNGSREVLAGKSFVEKVSNNDAILCDFTWYALIKGLTNHLGAKRCLPHFKGFETSNYFNSKCVTINGKTYVKANNSITALNNEVFYVWVNNELKFLIDGRTPFEADYFSKNQSFTLAFNDSQNPVIMLQPKDSGLLKIDAKIIITFQVSRYDFSHVVKLISTLAKSHTRVSVTTNPIYISGDTGNSTQFNSNCSRRRLEEFKSAIIDHYTSSPRYDDFYYSRNQENSEEIAAEELWNVSPSPVALTPTQPNTLVFKQHKSSLKETFSQRNGIESTDLSKSRRRSSISKNSFQAEELNHKQMCYQSDNYMSGNANLQASLEDVPSQSQISSTQMQSIPDSDVYSIDSSHNPKGNSNLIKRVKLHATTEKREQLDNLRMISNFETSTENGRSEADTSGMREANDISLMDGSSPLTSVGDVTASKGIILEATSTISHGNSRDPEKKIMEGMQMIFQSIQQFTQEITHSMKVIRESMAQTEVEVNSYRLRIQNELQNEENK